MERVLQLLMMMMILKLTFLLSNGTKLDILLILINPYEEPFFLFFFEIFLRKCRFTGEKQD